MLGRQNNKLIAWAFKANHAGLCREVLPFSFDFPDQNGAAGAVGRFMAAELIFRDTIAVEVNRSSVIVVAIRTGVAFQLAQQCPCADW